MTHAHNILALITLISLSAAQPVDATSDPVVVEIVASTVQRTEHAEWALSRFGMAGLDLPSLTIVFHDNYESCGMREGVLRIAGEDIVIHECERNPARSRRSILHELAHAWDRAGGQIDDHGRTEFLRLRALPSWDDVDLPWNRRGEEQAAEIIAWGLMHRPAPIPTSVGDHSTQDPAQLATAFTLLTGSPPLFDDSLLSGAAGNRTGNDSDCLAPSACDNRPIGGRSGR